MLNNWMSHLDNNAKLNSIVLPATHDSGMSTARHAVSSLINPFAWIAITATAVAAGVDDLRSDSRDHQFLHDNFCTQHHNVAGQLASGARQFDLRITKHNFTYRAYHGAAIQMVGGMRRWGERWQDICDGIAAFMKKEGGTEFLILKLDKQDSYTTDMMKMLSKSLDDQKYFPRFATTLMKDSYVDQEKIQNLRGRILVCGKKGALKDWSKIGGLNKSITLCEWRKEESGFYAGPPKAGIGYPIYLLLGGSEGGLSSGTNVLEKQAAMKKIFASKQRQQYGMRGIWFNTFSLVRDIAVYSDQIWDDKNSGKIRDLWLTGAARQNVASLDFYNAAKGLYIVLQNQSCRVAYEQSGETYPSNW